MCQTQLTLSSPNLWCQAKQPCTNPADAPIGVFDSGVGGLSVLAHIMQALPHERYVYLADTLHVPYGGRSAADIERLTIDAVRWLMAQGCKLVVIACNSASAYGLQAVRQAFTQVPIVGLVPAIKPAVLASQTRHIAVLATPATLNGALLNTVIAQVAAPRGVTVSKYSLASLVPWVEAGMPSGHVAVGDLANLLDTLSAQAVDYLVLGCTHYPFFQDYLRAQITQTGARLTLIDSGGAIARRVVSLLETANLLRPPSDLPPLTLVTTGDIAQTQAVATRLLAQYLPPRVVEFQHCGLMAQ